jgi:hypothetical protein
VHFHVLVPDGVFVETEEGAPAEFHELQPPSDEDVANLLSQVARRVTRLLERRGRLEENAAPTDALEVLKSASVQARLPLPQSPPSWAPPRRTTVKVIERLYSAAASLDCIGMVLLRSGLVVVLVWIGGLKFANYEADSIVPLVANSPVMPALGDTAHGFPYLSGAGRLIIKDAIMLGAAIVTLADSAKAYLRRSRRER